MLRNQSEGEPVCLTVSHLDSLVLARSGFNHSVDYRSAMAFGHARIVDDPDEKARALAAMIDRFYPGRWATLRPATQQEIKATRVIGMTIEQASAKIRAKGIGDDEEDYALPIYAERIPVRTVLGAPSPARASSRRRTAGGARGISRRADARGRAEGSACGDVSGVRRRRRHAPSAQRGQASPGAVQRSLGGLS